MSESSPDEPFNFDAPPSAAAIAAMAAKAQTLARTGYCTKTHAEDTHNLMAKWKDTGWKRMMIPCRGITPHSMKAKITGGLRYLIAVEGRADLAAIRAQMKFTVVTGGVCMEMQTAIKDITLIPLDETDLMALRVEFQEWVSSDPTIKSAFIRKGITLPPKEVEYYINQREFLQPQFAAIVDDKSLHFVRVAYPE